MQRVDPEVLERIPEVRIAVSNALLSQSESAKFTYDVFISYRRSETESLAVELFDYLRRGWHPVDRRRKLRVFLDSKSISIGENFQIAIQNAVQSSACFVVLLSPTYTKTEFTSFEEMLITRSDFGGLQRRIVPILVAGSNVPERLRPIQYLDWTSRERSSFKAPTTIKSPPRGDLVADIEQASGWLTARGEPSRSGWISESIQLPFSRLWSSRSEHTLNADLIVDELALYATEPHLARGGGFSHSELAAWDIHTGQERWRVRFSGYVRSCPAIVSGVLCAVEDASYFQEDESSVFGVSRATGEVLWRAMLRGHVDADVLPIGGDFIVACNSGKLARIEARTGQVYWYHKVTGSGLESQISATPDGGILAVSNLGALEHIDASSGSTYYRELLFRYQDGERNHIAVSGDQAFYAVEDTVFAIDWRKGRLLWKSEGHGGSCITLSVDSTQVYGIGWEDVGENVEASVSTIFSLALCANMSETLRHCKISVGRGGNHQ